MMRESAAGDGKARCRVFCFPYAGGSSQIFFSWRDALPEGFELVPIRYPGRGRAFSDPLIDNSAEMVDYIWDQIHPLLDLPYIFLGYSMGAMLSLELAHKAHARGLKHQLLQVICAYSCSSIAPGRRSRARHLLSDSELKNYVLELGGIRAADFDDDLWELYLPVLRADFKLLDTAVYRPLRPLETDALVFYGADDTMVTNASAADWSRHFTGGVEVKQLPGGHFFINESNHLLTALRAALAGVSRTIHHTA